MASAPQFQPGPAEAGGIVSFMDRIEPMITRIAEPLIYGAGFVFRMMGPFFCFGLYYLIWMHFEAFLFIISKVLHKRLGTGFALIWIGIGLVLCFNVVWNHFLAMIIKPGGPLDLAKTEELREYYKNKKTRKDLEFDKRNDDRFEGISANVKALLKYRTKTMGELRTWWDKKCHRCNDIKPARVHHCAVCDRCVFQMDHHCPWVNNCLGLDNLRYFLLFILYLFLGAVYYAITVVSIWNHHVYMENRSDLSFLVILDFALAGVLIAFNGWNWFLALTGNTTIEFWSNMSMSTREKSKNFDFSFTNATDNLFAIFGTHKLLRIMSPSLRNPPFTGIEWSFVLKDEGYDCDGEKQDQDNEEVEMTHLNQGEEGKQEITPEESHEQQIIDSAFSHQVVEDDLHQNDPNRETDNDSGLLAAEFDTIDSNIQL